MGRHDGQARVDDATSQEGRRGADAALVVAKHQSGRHGDECGGGRRRELPPLLTATETAAFNFCVANNVRIEQERLPQATVVEAVRELFAGTAIFGVR